MAMHHCSKADAQNRFEASVSRLPNGAIFGSLDTRSSLSSEYHTYTYSALWFRGRSFTLLSSYSEAEYEKAISLIEEHFWFRTDPVGTGPIYASSEKLIEPHVRISDCCFRIVYPGNPLERCVSSVSGRSALAGLLARPGAGFHVLHAKDHVQKHGGAGSFPFAAGISV